MSVDDQVMTVRKTNHNIRKWNAFPLFLVPLVITLKLLYEFGPTTSQINYANSVLSSHEGSLSRELVGEEFLNALVDEKGTSSWVRYVSATYSYGRDSQKRSLTISLTFIGLALLITILMARYLIKYPRYAEVYFDRKRGIVYTWHESKVA
ncbi:hypothetical protein, partial [Vibrio mexicanus]|uniref:hypothetical protein n=1 Tax=Vibrio mexicanus TaxID=1004326 RepID=UPI00063C186C